MRLQAPALLAAALGASVATADHLLVFAKGCRNWGDPNCDYSLGNWYSAFGINVVDGRSGCRSNPGPPGMTQLCLDYVNMRGHFYFQGQGKRCIWVHEWYNNWCADPGVAQMVGTDVCYSTKWIEVDCSW